MKNVNIIGSILRFAGYGVIGLGFILAFWSMQNVDVIGFAHIQYIISFLLIHVVVGIVLFGLSEIVNLLQILVNREAGDLIDVKYNVEKLYSEKQLHNKETVSEKAKAEIVVFYGAESINSEDIQATDLEDIYLVKRGDDIDIIELGGFSPIILSKKQIDKNPSLRKLFE